MRRALACIVLLGASHAIAAPTPAEQAFERGRVLLEQGQLAEACSAFAESVRLDFQYGALFNLATCEEQRGNLATALAAFQRIAAEDLNPTRAARSRVHSVDLQARVARLRVTIAAPMAGATLSVDDRPGALATPIPVDPGTHRLVVTAPGATEQTRTVEVAKPGELVEIAIDLRAPVDPSASHARDSPPPRRSRHTGTIVFGAGATSAAAGLVFGGLALRGWRDAQDRAMTDPDAANGDLDRVRLYGNTSTALVSAGLVAVAIGIYLWRR